MFQRIAKLRGAFFAVEAMKKAGINQTAPEFANEFNKPGRYFCPITVKIPVNSPSKRAYIPLKMQFTVSLQTSSYIIFFLAQVRK